MPVDLARLDAVAVTDGATDGDTGTGETDAGDASGDGPTGDVAGAHRCFTIAGTWQASAPFATDDEHVAHPLPSFAVGDYYYVHTMRKGGGERRLYAARIGADGSLGPWTTATEDHEGGPHGFTALVAGGAAYHFRNGHIARYELSDGVMSDRTLLEQNLDGSFSGARYVWDSAVVARFDGGDELVLHLGGYSFTDGGYGRALHRSGVPIGDHFEPVGREHPSPRPGKAAFVATTPDRGVLFTAGALDGQLWRSEVTPAGVVGPFVAAGALPAGTDNQRGDLLAHGRTLFAVRGAAVYRADVADDGALSPFAAGPALPEPAVDEHWGDGHLEGASHAIVGGRIYLTGPKRVYRATLAAGPCD